MARDKGRVKVFVAGHNGMVGAAIVRKLKLDACNEILTVSRKDLDLTNQCEVSDWIAQMAPDEIYLAAAKVGGILANSTFPAQFIYENLMIEANLIHSAYVNNVGRLLFLGSSCIYPKYAQQPISEVSLLTGTLESTNEPYAIAKIAGIKLCESYNRQYGCDFRSVMPTNLYGPGDNFHAENSHVIPALIRRFHEAVVNGNEQVVIWGSGSPLREFLHVDDMASACMHVMKLDRGSYQKYTEPMMSHLNVGSGTDCSIRELAEMIAGVTGFTGKMLFDQSKPDGTPRKLMDSKKLLQLGWTPSIDLEDGLRDAYSWFLNNSLSFRDV